jgi:hypothetical protein
MKLNLLATTAAAALVASGGVWAQPQAPGPKPNDKTQMHEQKGPTQQNRDEKQAGKERSGQAKSAQRAEDAQQNRNAAPSKMDAQKDDASSSAQSQQQPSAAENKKDEARSNARADKDQNAKSQATKEDKNQAEDGKKGLKGEPKAAEQQKAGDQNDQSKQRANQSKSGNQPRTNAAKSKTGNVNNQPTSASNQSTAPKSAPSSNQRAGSTNQQTGSTSDTQASNTPPAKLSETDRSKVFSTLKSNRQASNQRIDIDVNVGTRLPAHVRPRPLPRTVVQVLPQYQGYEFVMVRDEIAIVRPGTREVVDVIHEPGSSLSYAERTTTQGRGTIHLTDQQRSKLRDEARRFTTSQVSSSGNQCLSLQPLPASLAADNPDLKQYQMLAIGQDIVLIDPSSKKVVDVIQ